MTAKELHNYVGRFALVKIDGAAALARIGFDEESHALFLEYRPSPRSTDYALLAKLTRRDIDEIQPNGPNLVLTPMSFSLAQGKDNDAYRSHSNAGIWNR